MIIRTIWPIILIFGTCTWNLSLQVQNLADMNAKIITLKLGETVELFCKLGNNTQSLDNLSFKYVNGTTISKTEINETTIKIKFTSTRKAGRTVILCKHNKDILTHYSIHVGDKIMPNVTCLSENFQNVKCIFQQPNDRSMRYFLSYSVISHGATHSYASEDEAPVDFYDTEGLLYFPLEPILGGKYSINFMTSNNFGTSKKNIVFNIDEIVIPARLENTKVDEITSSSFQITWNTSLPVTTSKNSFIYNIQIKPDCDTTEETKNYILNNTNVTNGITHHHITGLKFPNCNYITSISYRVPNALYPTKQFSSPITIIVKTAKRIPHKPPNTYTDAYEYLPSNMSIVNLYWQSLNKSEWNDDQIQYEIFHVNTGHLRTVNGTKVKIFVTTDELNEFHIYSKNSLGKSLNFTVIKIPEHSKQIPNVRNMSKFIKHGQYILKWSPPQVDEVLAFNYTLVVCYSIDEQTNICKNVIEIIQISNKSTENQLFNYAKTQDGSKIFGISVQSAFKSSGLKWFGCATSAIKELSKVHFTIEHNTTSLHILYLIWDSRCDTPLRGYKIQYREANCSHCEYINTTIAKYENEEEDGTIKVPIANLKLFTNYIFDVAMFSDHDGPYTEKTLRTLPGPPTPPQLLEITNISSTAATIKWMPPEAWNGDQGSYNIIVAHNDDVQKSEKLSTSETHYELHNLKGYTNYSIYITSCNLNRFCSVSTTSVAFRTDVGQPGPVRKWEHTNLLGWDPPEDKSGEIAFYEYRFEWLINNQTHFHYGILNKTDHVCETEIDLCDQSDATNLFVRAINVINSTKEINLKTNTMLSTNYKDSSKLRCTNEVKYSQTTHYDCRGAMTVCLYGEWTPIHETDCQHSISGYLTFAIASLLATIFIAVVIYLVTKIRICITVQSEIPFGLQPIFQEELHLFRDENNSNIIINQRNNQKISTSEPQNNTNVLLGKLMPRYILHPQHVTQDNYVTRQSFIHT